MLANRYDRAAEAPIMNTYVPINFDLLYRVGAALREAVDQASKELQGAITTFGQFQSPSAIDTLNYYNLSIGKLKDLVQEASTNPDAMKDANFRSRLQSRINNLDYSALSMLKESAENQRLGLKTRALMEAEGRYNKRWDLADIPNYDTLANKRVFDNITPMRFMTADELSNPYFSNLKPSTLGTLFKDGVKYQREGITYDTLLGIADAKFNDLVNTPQGQQYYKEALQAAGGDKEAARQTFVGMIADSQRDRIVNQDSVDPYWLAMAKHTASGVGQPKIEQPLPTRQEKITYDLGNKAREVYGKVAEGPTGKQSARLMDSANKFAEASQVFADRYQKTKNEEDLIKAVQYRSRADEATKFAYDINRKSILKDEFERIALFGIKKNPKDSKEYSRLGYLRGVEGALDKVSSTTELAPDGDPLITRIGGTPQEYVTSLGLKTNVYLFNNSQGFLLPETVFLLSTETGPDEIKRKGTNFIPFVEGSGPDIKFPIREAIESGRIRRVLFIPSSVNNTMQLGNTKVLSGSLRIPAAEAERVLGKAIFSASTRNNLKSQYNMTEAEYGKDGEKYYEIPIYKALPSDDNLNYWDPINQLHENSTTVGGIGGATLASGMHPTSIESILRNSR